MLLQIKENNIVFKYWKIFRNFLDKMGQDKMCLNNVNIILKVNIAIFTSVVVKEFVITNKLAVNSLRS